MYTQCPQCASIYEIDAVTLRRARGKAYCSHCGGEFDCLLTLSQEPHDQAEPSQTYRHATPALPILTHPVSKADVQQGQLFTRPEPPKIPMPPSFAQKRASGKKFPALKWALSAAGLLLTLLCQLAWIYRSELLTRSDVQAFAKNACELLSCVLPMIDRREAIALLARDIRRHATVENALVISATLANRSDAAQSFPTVQITLSDASERKIAMRRFKPADYITNIKTIKKGFQANATVHFDLEIEDPGQDSVAFEFKFL